MSDYFIVLSLDELRSRVTRFGEFPTENYLRITVPPLPAIDRLAHALREILDGEGESHGGGEGHA